ncbi:hypothetical protein KIPB_015095, partial [Kipferlia bialata]|eukprot:g15095.t1
MVETEADVRDRDTKIAALQG